MTTTRPRRWMPALAALAAWSCAGLAGPRRPPPPEPGFNPSSRAKVELGRLLFFDKRMSLDGTVSCATCHDPARGWADGRPTARGVRQQLGGRNTPTVLNAAYRKELFWDGRAPSLEAQAKAPIAHPKEMAMSHGEAAARIAGIGGYAPYFERAFGDSSVDIERIVQALAAFQRTVVSQDSPYDRYRAGRESALSRKARRGLALFEGKARCAVCHTGPDLTDGRYHNVGAGMQRSVKDLGRYEISKEDKDRGAFRTPPLRNLTDTPPYMHDGSLATLTDVVDYFDAGGFANPWLSPEIEPLGLSEAEKSELLAFLEALTGDPVELEPPERLPE